MKPRIRIVQIKKRLQGAKVMTRRIANVPAKVMPKLTLETSPFLKGLDKKDETVLEGAGIRRRVPAAIMQRVKPSTRQCSFLASILRRAVPRPRRGLADIIAATTRPYHQSPWSKVWVCST